VESRRKITILKRGYGIGMNLKKCTVEIAVNRALKKAKNMILITPKFDVNGMIARNNYQALTDNSQFYYILFLGVYLHKDLFNQL